MLFLLQLLRRHSHLPSFLRGLTMVLFALGVLGPLLQPVIDQDIVNLVDVQVDVEVLVYM